MICPEFLCIFFAFKNIRRFANETICGMANLKKPCFIQVLAWKDVSVFLYPVPFTHTVRHTDTQTFVPMKIGRFRPEGKHEQEVWKPHLPIIQWSNQSWNPTTWPGLQCTYNRNMKISYLPSYQNLYSDHVEEQMYTSMVLCENLRLSLVPMWSDCFQSHDLMLLQFWINK